PNVPTLIRQHRQNAPVDRKQQKGQHNAIADGTENIADGLQQSANGGEVLQQKKQQDSGRNYRKGGDPRSQIGAIFSSSLQRTVPPLLLNLVRLSARSPPPPGRPRTSPAPAAPPR